MRSNCIGLAHVACRQFLPKKTRTRMSREQNLADHAERQREYRKRFPEQTKASMLAWHNKHPDYERVRSKRRYANDPSYRARIKANAVRFANAHPEYYRAAAKLRRARICRVECTLTMEQSRELFEEYAGLCVYCFDQATTLDHVIPIVSGGAHSKDNLVPCCKSCNSKKGTKPLLVFLAYRKAA